MNFNSQLSLNFHFSGVKSLQDFSIESHEWENKEKFLNTIEAFQSRNLLSTSSKMRMGKDYCQKLYSFASQEHAQDFVTELLQNGSINQAALSRLGYDLKIIIS